MPVKREDLNDTAWNSSQHVYFSAWLDRFTFPALEYRNQLCFLTESRALKEFRCTVKRLYHQHLNLQKSPPPKKTKLNSNHSLSEMFHNDHQSSIFKGHRFLNFLISLQALILLHQRTLMVFKCSCLAFVKA